jgi:methylated-DNA-[protein]-cysteine S-methyltransferase
LTRTAYRYFVFETARGFCGIAWSGVGIARLQLPAASAQATGRELLRRLPDAAPATSPPRAPATVDAVKRYFEGEPVDFSAVPLDLEGCSELHQLIYAAVRRIGWGHTTTYGTVARELEREPQAARLVGQAMAANPVPLIIPCHRVLAAGGKLGGFSAPGGPVSKLAMLALEGVHVHIEQPGPTARPARPLQRSLDL